MRRWTIAALALAIVACNKQQTAQDVARADEELARDNLEANDLTAIDAASGADANMAADIDFTNRDVDSDNRSTTGAKERSDKSSQRPTNDDSPPKPSDGERPAAANETVPPETSDGA